MSEIDLKDAKCTGLSFQAPVLLASENGEGNGFKIEAYTGEVVERWWGMLGIEVSGIKAKKKIPVLLNHDTSQIVGYSTNTFTDGSFFVIGKFSEVTEPAKEAKALAGEGFPWQASIGVRPLKIMALEAGGEMVVNGKKLKGPAEVWLESEVIETSFVPLGADSKTSISTFSKFTEQAPQGAEHKTNKKEKAMEITMDTLAKDAPDLLAQIQTDAKKAGYDEGLAAGSKGERDRVTAILAEEADEATKLQAVKDGLSVDGAYKLFFQAEKKKKSEGLEKLETSTPETAGHQAKETDHDDKETYFSAVDAYQKENKCSRTDALKAIAKDRPALHAAFLTGGK